MMIPGQRHYGRHLLSDGRLDYRCSHHVYTLMHDPQYRVEIARQQTTYNQPAYPSFYLASDTDWSKVPLIKK